MNKLFAVGLLVLGLVPGPVFAVGSNNGKINRDIHQLKRDYEKKVDKDLKEIGLKIEHLKHQALKTGTHVKTDTDREIKRLEAKKAGAERKFAALRKSSGGAWKDLSRGVDDAVEDLRRSVDEAAQRIKGEK